MDPAWCFPGCNAVKSKQLHRIFDDRRVSSDNPSRIKASCAELLALYGLLRHFVECEVPMTEETSLHRRSFLAVCRVLDLLLQAKHCHTDARAAAIPLEVATSHFLECHKAAYGTVLVKPKHHWQLDVPRQLARDGMVLDAFVIERRHLDVKAVAEKVKNTSNYEASVLSSLSTVQWRQAANMTCRCGLVGRTAPGGDPCHRRPQLRAHRGVPARSR